MTLQPPPRQSAEWAPHEACWLAWPSHEDLWLDALPSVRESFVTFVGTILDLDPATGDARGERIDLLVPDAGNEELARESLAHLATPRLRLHRIPFGDIWLRDTAPVFVTNAEGGVEAVSFTFNGWGGKYVLPFDAEVSLAVAAASGRPTRRVPLVFEGGSTEVDGSGTCLTTRQCLLNPNRNPSLSPDEIEGLVKDGLGAERVLWLSDGLLNDHTDGHIDTIARFVAPGVVVCMEPRSPDDPNREVLLEIRRDLSTMRDAEGRRLEVHTVPSPGRVLSHDGDVMAASYVNFYVANTTVTVPTYGTRFDDEAVAAIARLFPTRRAVGVPARDLLEGGGAFHCISQQQPRERRAP